VISRDRFNYEPSDLDLLVRYHFKRSPNHQYLSVTAIEQALFRDGSAHCVSSIRLSSEELLLTLHPWERAAVVVQASFHRPRIVSTDDTHAGDDIELPWDIIGFDSEQLPDGGWRFCLHTDAIEYVFDSSWPQITHAADTKD
jgi:hypothetical protein